MNSDRGAESVDEACSTWASKLLFKCRGLGSSCRQVCNGDNSYVGYEYQMAMMCKRGGSPTSEFNDQVLR